jgi:aubergine-like protein
MSPIIKSQKDDRWKDLFGGTRRRRTHKKRYQDRRDYRDRRDDRDRRDYQDRRDDIDRRERRGGKKGCKRSKRRR